MKYCYRNSGKAVTDHSSIKISMKFQFAALKTLFRSEKSQISLNSFMVDGMRCFSLSNPQCLRAYTQSSGVQNNATRNIPVRRKLENNK